MSLEPYIEDLLNLVATGLNDAHADPQSIAVVLDRLALRNRFWPSELFFATYSDLRGDCPPQLAGVAAAIELLHVCTLVQDDVIDQHNTRWSLPSLRSTWGDGKTILWGDYLATTAIRILMTAVGSDMAACSVTTTIGCWRKILLGQMLDLEFSSRATISWDEYVRVATLKTSIGALAVQLGALLGTAGDRESQFLLTLANWAGVSSQVANDFSEVYGIRGFVAPYGQISDRGSEIALGRKTIFHAFFHDKQTQQHQILNVLSPRGEPGEISALLLETGALQFAVDAHAEMVKLAILALKMLDFPAPSLAAYLAKANPLRVPNEALR